MPRQIGVDPYTLQNGLLANQPVPKTTKGYPDQPTWSTHQQIRGSPREGPFLTTNVDDVYEQKRPARDFTTKLKALHRYYTILDDDHIIIELLQREPELYPLLLDAVEPLHEAFGGKRLIYMRVQTSDEDSILRVAVWLPANVGDEAERALQAFDENWWLHNCHRSGGALVFDYEMQHAI